ncbi:hypothetical protein [Halococcus thailandensis]|uniref:Uncharacterized protein n=1 Tax=Halococcus thailandensis JCM 13552 TaxID=1227457 RepID=M0MTL4_9EURY|nr:hypothetical protein [Halococcus thailandensis]EMA48683.1 hypothetical protein C451_19983 [Halococcus thailandensis JCM 13552]
MSVETTDTTDTADSAGEQAEDELVAILCGLDESAEPWKLRPPENGDDPAKLLVGARPDFVRDRLEDAGYEMRDLELPVSARGWLAAWEISSG